MPSETLAVCEKVILGQRGAPTAAESWTSLALSENAGRCFGRPFFAFHAAIVPKADRR